MNIRKAFPVIIRDKQYFVWDIEGKEHEGMNDTVKTWWLYYSDELPSDLIPPLDSPYWKPMNVSLNRMLWEIRFKQTNSSKEKWGETDFRNHTNVEMWCNNKLVYSFGTTGTDRGLSFAFGKVAYLQTVLCEHCFNFFEPETENGRKIYWYGMPATVVISTYKPWEIRIKPDYTTGLSKVEWWKEYLNRCKNITELPNEDTQSDDEDNEEDKMSDLINWGDALSDGHINWFRK